MADSPSARDGADSRARRGRRRLTGPEAVGATVSEIRDGGASMEFVEGVYQGQRIKGLSLGQAVFAATIAALGILGLIQGNFTPTWTGVPKRFPAREGLAYLCALVS